MSAPQLVFTNLFFYLIGFVVLLLLRRRIAEQSVSLLSLLINLIGVLFSLGLSVSNPPLTESFQWFSLGKLNLSVDLLFNNLTLLLYFLVQFIGFWVQVFSVNYMRNDPSFGRYFAYINLFIFAMLGVVIAGNLVLLYISWELVGFCSYLLIGFWYKRKSATNAAKKAFLMNRIGDTAFLLGIFLVYHLFKTVSITDLATQLPDPSVATPMLTVAGLMLFGGCIGKSAQFPLQTWLPDAMEGPTPASALIHAATMVAAGIFLMARIAPLLTPEAGTIIASVGVFTALLAGYSAIFQYDIKKVLAYSTVSQLGLMVMGIGIGATHEAIFHLTTHAFFKAGLFLAAGTVIHVMHHEQDMRKMGGLRKQLPFLFIAYGICAASLMGLPFTAGFLSKDGLLIAAFSWVQGKPTVAYALPIGLLLAIAFTAFYTTRQLILVFFEREGSTLQAIWEGLKGFWFRVRKNSRAMLEGDQVELIEEEKFSELVKSIGLMELAVGIMAIASLFVVFSMNPFSMENASFAASFPLLPHPAHNATWIVGLALGVTLLSIWLSYLITKAEIRILNASPHPLQPINWWARLGFHHYYLNKIYSAVFVKPLVNFSEHVEELEHLPLTTDKAATTTTLPLTKGFSKWLHRFDTDGLDTLVTGISQLVIWLGDALRWLEEWLVDGLVRGVGQVVQKIGSYTRHWQGGEIQNYLAALFAAIILLIMLVLL